MIYQLLVPGPITDVEEVRILQWHGAPGQAFAPGDLIVELETFKALVEVRAGQPGMLRRILCEEGAWAAVGAPLAVLSDTPGEALPDAAEGLAAWAVAFEVT